MRCIKGLILTSCLFVFGCRYGMSDAAFVVENNPELFDKRGKLQQSIGIDVGNNKFLAILPKGVKGNIAEAINIKRASLRDNLKDGVKFSLFRGNSEKISENTSLGSYEISMKDAVNTSHDIRLILGILDRIIVMEASAPSSGTTLSIQKLK